jgi:putative spermidine/putrescine transport system permease protein
MGFTKKLKSKSFVILVLSTFPFFVYTHSLIASLVFLLIFGFPFFAAKKLPPYATWGERLWRQIFLTFCIFVFLFLITPILVIIPLSFNSEPYFTFTDGMIRLDPSAYSLRWYRDILNFGMMAPNASDSSWWRDMWNNSVWIGAFRNSFFIATMATLLATTLGTLAALGLSRPKMPYRATITSLLISPMIVPLVISATGMFFFYAKKDVFPFYPDGLTNTFLGLALAHATLGVPFVIITVTATLSGFDQSLIRAAQGLGASGFATFRKVILPLILPGMISGALFAFITSFDEVVAVIFLANVDQRTIPRQMFSGIREQISPTILAVATLLVLLSIALLSTIELLRRRTERLRGLTPG